MFEAEYKAQLIKITSLEQEIRRINLETSQNSENYLCFTRHLQKSNVFFVGFL